MKRLFSTTIILALLMSLYARQFDGIEQMYINTKQNDAVGDWTKDGAYIGAYFFKGTNGQFTNAATKVATNLYVVTVPEGEWDHVIVTRHSSSSLSWSNMWNQTGNMPLYYTEKENGKDVTKVQTGNYIREFWEKGTSAGYGFYSPATTAIPAVSNLTTELRNIQTKHNIKGNMSETLEVCTEAIGDIIALHPRVNDQNTGYTYDVVTAHAWYKSSNGTSWTSIDNYAGTSRTVEEGTNANQKKDIYSEKVTNTGTVWYYLFSANPQGRRLVKVQVSDYAKCKPTCEITSLEYAISAVNADDNTYTLDGMVAFGEAKGNLTISCENIDTVITQANAVSPVTFKLRGLSADKKQHTLKAEFKTGGCSKEIIVTAPDATAELDEYTIQLDAYQTTTITPQDYIKGAQFVWTSEGMEANTTDQLLSIGTFDHDTIVYYYYREYNAPVANPTDLMQNGSYEDNTFNYGTIDGASTISDYKYWGYNPTESGDFYDKTPHIGASGGFAVTKNAKNFNRNFASVTAHHNQHFALFDAEQNETGKKRAWHTTIKPTTGLALQKGATYLFSFWVANINNYGEMNNAAKLQFCIQYNGKTDWMEPIDLNEFKDNLWHQSSATYIAKEDASEITISVVNRNTSPIFIGNDFALDDIRFNLIASRSDNVRTYQKYKVVYTEPVCKINSFTANSPTVVGCDEDTYNFSVDLTFTDTKDKGYLYIKDETTNQIIHTSPNTTPSSPYHVDFNNVAVDNNTTHTLTAYFEKVYAGVKKGCEAQTTYSYHPTRTFATPVLISVDSATCDNNKHNIRFEINYANQDGGLEVRDENNNVIYTNATPPANKLQDNIINLPVDGKDHTITFNFLDANDCKGLKLTYRSPKLPHFDIPSIIEVDSAGCGDTQHWVRFSITYANQNGSLEIRDEDNKVVYTKTAPPATSLSDTIKNLPVDGKKHTLYFNFTGANDCKGQTAQYISPKTPYFNQPQIIEVDSAKCSETEHWVRFNATYFNQHGAFEIRDENSVVVYSNATPPANSLSDTIKHLPADGKTHTLTFNFLGDRDCKGQTVQYLSPKVPYFNQPQIISVDSAACDNDKHSLTFSISYFNQHGALEVRDENNIVVYQNTTPPATTLTDIINNLPSDGKTHTLTFNFLGSKDCSGESVQYLAPKVPHISQFAITPDDKIVCGHSTYAAQITIEAQNQTGDMQLLLDGSTIETTAATADFSFTRTYNIDVDQNDPNGTINHTLTVQFVGGANANCCSKSITFRQPQITDLPQISMQNISRECEDVGQLKVPYSIIKGNPTLYSITFSNSLFTDVTDLPLSGGSIDIDVPAGIGGGIYTASVTVKEDANSCISTPISFQFELAQGGWMYRKWNDVIFVSNKDDDFASYQWYKNGVELDGEVGQRLYDPDGLSGNFYCRIITNQGDTIYTCEQTYDDVARSADEANKQPIEVSPRIVAHSAPISILHNNDLTIDIFTTTGILLQHLKLSAEDNQIIAPSLSGSYIIQMREGEQTETVHIIVQ